VDRHRLAARIVQESDRVPAILTMVAAGSGVTMVPQGITHLISTGVHFRKLPSPQPVLQHTFAYRARTASPLLEDFLTLLRKMERTGAG
jgi:DNA-binding transcriptional LysR family regulator